MDDEMAEKVREALEMMLMAPAGTSMNDFMSRFQVSEQDLPAFNIMWQKIIYPMNDMGFDVLQEIDKLNEEIGDGTAINLPDVNGTEVSVSNAFYFAKARKENALKIALSCIERQPTKTQEIAELLNSIGGL